MSRIVDSIANKIRHSCVQINKIISRVKEIFLLAPMRVQIYKKIYQNLLLQQEPILTRRGTWIHVAFFLWKKNEMLFRIFSKHFAIETHEQLL